jgi:aspartate 1-decarboxylase
VGSLTVDADLKEAADLLAGEQVHVVDINNGARLGTSVIEGPGGSGVIGINGPRRSRFTREISSSSSATRHSATPKARTFVPCVVHVDAGNRVLGIGADPAEPVPDAATVRGDAVRTG